MSRTSSVFANKPFFLLSGCLLSFYVSMNVVCVNDIGRDKIQSLFSVF